QHADRALAAGLRMREQRDAMRPVDPLDTWRGGDERFHYVELSEHGGREDRRPRPVRDQILRDLAVADVRCGAERILPIAEAPVPRGAGERRLPLHELV